MPGSASVQSFECDIWVCLRVTVVDLLINKDDFSPWKNRPGIALHTLSYEVLRADR